MSPVNDNPEYYWVKFRYKDEWKGPTVGMYHNGLWYIPRHSWFYKDHDIQVLERIPDHALKQEAEKDNG